MILKRWQDWKAKRQNSKAKMQFNGKVPKLSKNESKQTKEKLKKRKHCSSENQSLVPEKEGCWGGADVLGSCSGGTQRPERCQRALTWPGADRRGQRSSVEHLETNRRIDASTVETEGRAALLETP